MGLSLACLLLTLLSLFQLSFSLCHENEHLSLMQFKQSFVTDNNRGCAAGFAKLDSWKFEGSVSVDCCSWEGVECDRNTGHVIGLDLSSSCLHGSLNSSSPLFNLLHLQKLNLSNNHFNYSAIPSAMGNLSMLTHLNLSNCVFSGQIPLEISKLFRLSSLDLSSNWDPYALKRFLELQMPDLKTIIQNLTSLEELSLSYVDVASPLPRLLANFSSLRSLYFTYSGLLGEFPTSIFHLPKLQTLWLTHNLDLKGYFPEFNFSSQLKKIALLNTSFSGELPASIGNLFSLETLGIGDCNFSGLLPSTLGNLPNLQFLDLGHNVFRGSVPSTLGNLTKLSHLELESNSFSGELPVSFGNLPKLETLKVGNNHFRGSVPSTLGNLTKLSRLELQYNSFSGPIPSELMNLTQLTYLNLMVNMLQGSIPSSISRLKKLEFFDADSNQLSGIVELDAFLELKDLKNLFLSLNNLNLVSRNTSASATNPQLVNLGVRHCHLREFPYFLHTQQHLELLDLSSNNIQGQIPIWMSNVSIGTLMFLDLSNNSLTGFAYEFRTNPLPWSILQFLKLDSNILQGPLPVPPFSTSFYSISNNSLTGEMPPLLCNQSYLSILDISYNKLSGEIPQCLSNFSTSLLVLKLRANNFHGSIPHLWPTENMLNMIDLSINNLQGEIPKSLINCGMLEYLDLGSNHISDVFPSWLGALPQLNVLLLRSNALHGTIGYIPNDHQSNFFFPKLRIIDLSSNRFSGALPQGYFERWNSMRSLDTATNSSTIYMLENMDMIINGMHVPRDYAYTMTITNKGSEMEYPKIIQTFVAIDLSNNSFDGEIPESIGNLEQLRLLNLSNNNLVGQIQLAIAKLTKLESLDLSHNKLEGRIPEELKQLNFLSAFSVSHNHLTGPIPQGGQFDTFENASFFDENPGLCGKQLQKECDENPEPPPSEDEDEDDGSGISVAWKGVLAGYGSGLLIGIVIGHFVFTRKRDLLEKDILEKSKMKAKEKLKLNGYSPYSLNGC